MKYSYSTDEERYEGTFETIEAACDAAAAEVGVGRHFWVGEVIAPPAPEDFWNATDWLEHVSCQDEYSGEWAEGWDDCTKQQQEELEKAVRAVMGAWLDRHDLRPAFWNIEKPRRFFVAGKIDNGIFEIEAV